MPDGQTPRPVACAGIRKKAHRLDHRPTGLLPSLTFLLKQYEFLAAATRLGAVDFVLTHEIMDGQIRDHFSSFSVQIAEMQRTQPKPFRDLMWLQRTISGSRELFLDPPG